MNVQTLSRPAKAMSIDEFFDWIETKKEKYELVDGRPVLQPWVKRNHARIVSNIDFLIVTQIDRDAYNVFRGDFAISTGARSIRYADILVERAGGTRQDRTTENAVLVVEVLSPSTTAEDFGPKQREYLGLSTLDTCLIAAQDSRCVWHWTRDDKGEWPEEPVVVEDGSIELGALGVTLQFDQIYRNVD